jgi:pimeloyl-ACP methyl ester carboxylesterase
MLMICTLDDLHVYYETYGEGLPVLMIHGYGIDHHVMTGCMEPIFMRRPGWKRIYFDLPGMGQTRAPRWLHNADQMLDILTQFIKQVIPEERFLVVGESYGGYLARALVHHMPECIRGVLLLCPVIVADRRQRSLPPRHVFVNDAELLAHIEPGAPKRLFERTMVVQDKRRWDRFQQDIVPGICSKDRAFITRFREERYGFSFDVDDLEHPFAQPSLVLSGRQDTSVGYCDMLRIIPNYPRGTFAVLDWAGHGLEVEQEAVFNCMVNEWLDRVEERPD